MRAPLLILIGSCLAWAGGPTIVILPVASDTASERYLGRVTYAAEVAARRFAPGEVRSLHQVLDPAGAQTRAQALGDAEAATDAGVAAYDQLDARSAFQAFERATELYEGSDLSDQAFDRLLNAWTLKIAAAIAGGNHRQAHAEIDKLLVVKRDAALSPTFFPPDDIAYGEKARSRVAQTKARLSASSTIPGSIAVLDGRYLGGLPQEIEVANGEHFLTLITPGFSLLQQKVSPGESTFAPPRAAFTEAFHAAARMIAASAGPLSEPAPEAAAEFGKAVQVDQVLVVAMRLVGNELRLSALWLRVSDGQVLQRGAQACDPTGPKLEQTVDAWISGLLGTDRTKPSNVGGWNRRTTTYVVLGGAAALLAGGIIFGIQASNDSSTFRRLPQTDPSADAFRSSGRAFAFTADVMFFGALVAGTTGASFLFSERPP